MYKIYDRSLENPARYREAYISETKINKSTGEYVTDKNKIGYSVAMFAKQNKGITVNYAPCNSVEV